MSRRIEFPQANVSFDRYDIIKTVATSHIHSFCVNGTFHSGDAFKMNSIVSNINILASALSILHHLNFVTDRIIWEPDSLVFPNKSSSYA